MAFVGFTLHRPAGPRFRESVAPASDDGVASIVAVAREDLVGSLIRERVSRGSEYVNVVPVGRLPAAEVVVGGHAVDPTVAVDVPRMSIK